MVFLTRPHDVPGYAYRFLGEHPFHVIMVGSVSCRVIGIYVPGPEIFIGFGAPDALGREEASIIEPFRHFLEGNFERCARHFGRFADVRPTPSVLVHSYHFAHALWNELSALDGLLGSFRSGAKIFVAQAPFGKLDLVFPELSSHVVLVGPGALPFFLADVPERMILWIPLGRVFMPRSTIERVKRVARAQRDPDVKFSRQIRDAHRYVLWLTVRQDIRVWKNQASVVAKLLDGLVARYGTVAVIVDGFTPGEGGVADPRTIDAETAVVREMLDLARSSFTVVSLIGAHLQQAVVWGSIADCYLAHHGTLQHKIAWLHDVEGICHYFPPKDFVVSKFPAVRAREGARIPTYVLADAGSRDHRPQDVRNDLFSYVLPEEKIIEAVLDAAPRTMDGVPAVRAGGFHEVRDPFYQQEAATKLLRDGDAQWASGNAQGALMKYAEAMNKAPGLLRVHQRMLEFMLMNLVSWFRSAECAQMRLLAFHFLIRGIDPDNDWINRRFVEEISSLPLEEFADNVEVIRRSNPTWPTNAARICLEMRQAGRMSDDRCAILAGGPGRNPA